MASSGSRNHAAPAAAARPRAAGDEGAGNGHSPPLPRAPGKAPDPKAVNALAGTTGKDHRVPTSPATRRETSRSAFRDPGRALATHLAHAWAPGSPGSAGLCRCSCSRVLSVGSPLAHGHFFFKCVWPVHPERSRRSQGKTSTDTSERAWGCQCCWFCGPATHQALC